MSSKRKAMDKLAASEKEKSQGQFAPSKGFMTFVLYLSLSLYNYSGFFFSDASSKVTFFSLLITRGFLTGCQRREEMGP